MSIKNKASIVGAFEHPTRHAPDKTVAQLHAECAKGALEDAGLSLSDVDGYFCAGDAPGIGALSMVVGLCIVTYFGALFAMGFRFSDFKRESS